MYTCLAIDDELASLKILTYYIELQPELDLIKAFTNPIVALNEIKKLNTIVDIIFLDIEMPDINGIELAKLIRHKTKKLVFTTAFSSYAINSYELEADGFLLKPISLVRFDQTTKKLFSSLDIRSKDHLEYFIVVKSIEQRNRFVKIRIGDIIAVEAQERTTKIYTKEEIINSNSSLAKVSELLVFEKTFHRIHRSFIISENHLKTLERTFVILSNSLKISIGRRYSELYYKLSKNNR
jgi:DNA-binding LytR/AlgR family response regulator